jgi:hypothetical protein
MEFRMREERTPTEANKALARLWFAERWNKGNVSVADGIFSQHFTLSGVEVRQKARNRTSSRLGKEFCISPLPWKTRGSRMIGW